MMKRDYLLKRPLRAIPREICEGGAGIPQPLEKLCRGRVKNRAGKTARYAQYIMVGGIAAGRRTVHPGRFCRAVKFEEVDFDFGGRRRRIALALLPVHFLGQAALAVALQLGPLPVLANRKVIVGIYGIIDDQRRLSEYGQKHTGQQWKGRSAKQHHFKDTAKEKMVSGISHDFNQAG
jgi:hypothetical protein